MTGSLTWSGTRALTWPKEGHFMCIMLNSPEGRSGDLIGANSSRASRRAWHQAVWGTLKCARMSGIVRSRLIVVYGNPTSRWCWEVTICKRYVCWPWKLSRIFLRDAKRNVSMYSTVQKKKVDAQFIELLCNTVQTSLVQSQENYIPV